ncbi:MAG: UDP-glucose 4-epimerase GalE [Gammaproteobacteria bacterium]|nr:UDP-glucose 4-epimerase GalE [Gammaproteobacteria bacterium]
MSRILVTGGAGYIGSHACKTLAANGFEPVSFDNLVYGHRDAVKWGPLEEGDITDRERISEVLGRYKPVAVMHFAAYAYVGESVQDPAKYYANNVGGSLTLLAAMRNAGINKIVFSSSCATYGVPEHVPIVETEKQAPINPYGMTKLIVENVLRDYGTAYGLRSASLRYFNACGADPDAEIGEDHDPETHLIPRAMMAVSGEIPELDLFGTDYDTPDGTCIRDYVHVTDLADAHVKALQRLLDGGQTFGLNLGTGSGFSVREVIAAVERVSERKVPVNEQPRRAGDPPVLVADVAQAKRVLDFEARFTDIDEIVNTAWNWHQRPRPQQSVR